jgi:glycosyltransferase involved in cell wall biosynthesis
MTQVIPLVSVCVTTYNHKNYIAECLDGILMQKTTFPFEIILGEDESTDGTREICQDYAEKHPDIIKLFLRSREDVIKINDKPTGRFNFIENLNAAKGKYIALCEGDDYWTDPLKLQKQVDFLEANKTAVVCYHNAKIIDSTNDIISNSKLSDYYKKDFEQEELISGTFVLTLTMCFRNCIKKFPSEFYKVKNGDTFLISMLGKHGSGKYLESIEDACYRVHSNGVWSSLDRLQQAQAKFKTYDYLKVYYNSEGDIASIKIINKQMNVWLVNLIENEGNKLNFLILKKVFAYNSVKIRFMFLHYFLLKKIFNKGWNSKQRLLKMVTKC